MSAGFAALETRLNQAVFARMSNATALLGGESLPVIFDMAGAIGSVGPAGMATTAPTCVVNSAALPVDVVGQPITIGVRAYTVAAHEPDGTGISRLWLLEATP